MLQYICQNPSCSAPENKKGKSYPAAMDCPFCDEPLVQSVQLDETEITLLQNLPYLIAYPLQDTFQQNDYEKKLHRLAYTFNNFLKYLGLISISEFIHSDFKSRKMIDLFESNIGEPSFGRWNQFIRESYALLFKEKVKLVFPEVYKFYQKSNEKKFKIEVELIDDFGDVNYSEKNGMTAIDMLINFRNKYLGHGTPLSDKQAKSLWDFYYPIFKDLLQLMTAQLALLMYKKESDSCWKLQSTEITETSASPEIDEARVWLADEQGRKLPLIPFFIIPTLLGDFERESKLMVYEAYNGQSMKFFSPENIVKETSGEILQRLKLLLREKQKEVPFSPENFGKTQLIERLKEENTWVLETLLREKKIIEGVYQQRQAMEIKLREWIGAMANIFFIAAEAGSGKTNLLVEMLKQYKERNIPAIFLRAARMQKDTLQEELAYRLNIDENHSLEDYKIAGTQAEPTIILLDGLNEAKNSEAIWDEILQLSKQFEPGALKFIIGNRANAKDDLNRYPIAEADELLLYGEKKEKEKGLYAYAHWLTPMDMQEMKGAWDHYYQLKKGIYRPNFDFDKIAQFDRGIYNQISNPLVMRLFLELYHGKSLPKKGRHLNIWKDWFHSFSAEEQSFMQNLAALIWEKGANELLFDTVQKSELMKAFFTDEKSKIPYQRLLKNGWISRYSKDLDAYIAFTVEGLLLYILGLQLYNQSPEIDLAAVEDLMQSGKKLKKAALDSFLAELAQRDEMELITALIDSGGDKIGICTTPLLLSMKNRGVKALLDKVFENATEHDWEALFELDKRLEGLQLHVLRKDFLREVMPRVEYNTKKAICFGLKAILIFDIDDSLHYFNKIDDKIDSNLTDIELLIYLGRFEEKLGNYDNALKIFLDCVQMMEDNLNFKNEMLAFLHENIGSLYDTKSEYKKAMYYHKKSLNIKYEIFGFDHPEITSTIDQIGYTLDNMGDFKGAIENYEKSLGIKLRFFGEVHPDVGISYNNIGLAFDNNGDYENALAYYEKSLNIFLVTLGNKHPWLAASYNNIANIMKLKSAFEKAIDFHNKGLSIEINVFGEHHPDVSISYDNLGNVYKRMGELENAMKFYQKSLDIKLKTFGFKNLSVAKTYNNIGKILFLKGESEKALQMYNKCLKIELFFLKNSHTTISKTYENIGDAYEKIGEMNKCKYYLKKAIKNTESNETTTNSNFVEIYYKIGNVYLKEKKHKKALEYFKYILKFKLDKMGFVNIYLNKNYSVAQCYESLHNIPEAFSYYLQAAEIRKEQLGIEDPKTIEAIDDCRRLAKELDREGDMPDWMK